MRAIKKTTENLINVAHSICKVNYSVGGKFDSDFKIIDNCVVLTSIGRDSIGQSFISQIPCNYKWRVAFSHVVVDIVKLYIWI